MALRHSNPARIQLEHVASLLPRRNPLRGTTGRSSDAEHPGLEKPERPPAWLPRGALLDCRRGTGRTFPPDDDRPPTSWRDPVSLRGTRREPRPRFAGRNRYRWLV